MRTLEKIEEVLNDFDLDGASGFYETNLRKAARAVVEALKNVDYDLRELPTEHAFRAAGYDEALAFWNATLDEILNEKEGRIDDRR